MGRDLLQPVAYFPFSQAELEETVYRPCSHFGEQRVGKAAEDSGLPQRRQIAPPSERQEWEGKLGKHSGAHGRLTGRDDLDPRSPLPLLARDCSQSFCLSPY